MKNIVHLRDCMDFMRGLPDKAYDLAIVDPIYGVPESGYREANRGKKGKPKKYHNAFWKQKKTGPEYFKELFRVSRNQIIFGGNYFIDHLYSTRCLIIWDKDNTGDFADAEIAWASFNSSIRIFKYRWNGMLQENMGNKEIRIHPTQKPVALYKWILKNYARPGQTIFDSHIGSGSIRIACHDLGFDFEGCEVDPVYHAAQDKRFQEYIAQPELFDKAEIQSRVYEDLPINSAGS